MNFKIPNELQKELNQKVAKPKQPEFIKQAVLSALGKIHKQTPLDLKAKTDSDRKRVGTYSVYTDGGARGNPGIAGCGGVVFNEKMSKVAEFKFFIPHATNNEAEYKALQLGVKEVLIYNPQKVVFYLDSELVVKQMNGEYKIKKPELRVIHLKIQPLISKIPEVSFVHIPREKNKLADKLANAAMDEQHNY